MTTRPHTICWGLAIVAGLALPIGRLSTAYAGQSVPPPTTTGAPATPASATAPTTPPAKPAAPPAPPAPYTVAWKQQTGSDAALDPTLDLVVSPAGVVTAGQKSALQSRSLDTGSVTWTSDLSSWQSIAEGQGLVFGLSGPAVYAFDAATGEKRWQAQVTGEPAHLVVAPTLLMASIGSTLHAFRMTDGGEAWAVDLGSVATMPSASPGSVTVGLANGGLVALDLATGAIQWRTNTFGTPEAVALGPRYAYVTLTGGTACAYRLKDGAFAWCFNLRIPIVGEPLLGAKLLYLALMDSTLRALDPVRGQLKQQERLGARPAGGALPAGDAVFVPLRNGDLAFFAVKDGRPLPRVTPGPAAASQQLLHAALSRDGALVGTLTVAPGSNQTLTLYRKTPPPPPVAKPDAAAAPTTPPAPAK